MIDPNWRPPMLPTARLRLRPFDECDGAGLFEYASNPNVTRFTLWEAHKSLDDTLAYVGPYARSSYLERVPEPLAIELTETGRVVGAIGCRWASRKDQCMELGYWIAEPFWGRGLALEASRAIVGHVFATYEVERVQAHHMDGNRASGRVLEELGMTFEGVCRRSLFHRGRFWDQHSYSVLRDEWRG